MNKDSIKEKISFLKLILTTCFAFLAGSTAWLINNTNHPVVYFDVFLIIVLIALTQYCIAEILTDIKKLED